MTATANVTAELELMTQIKSKYATSINAAVQGTPFPPALLAALTANESGLDEGATRLEPAVYIDLSLVLTGRRAQFNEIGAADLKTYLGDIANPATAVLALLNLATSWGPTQIMGWQAVRRGYKLAELTILERHYVRTAQILLDFGRDFKILPPPGIEPFPGGWESFFRCWNSGSPTGKTFDPNYPANGVRRLALYEGLE